MPGHTPPKNRPSSPVNQNRPRATANKDRFGITRPSFFETGTKAFLTDLPDNGTDDLKPGELWESTTNWRRFIAEARDPKSIPSIWGDTADIPSPLRRPTAAYVWDLEEAYYANEGVFGLRYLAELELEDLQLFKDFPDPQIARDVQTLMSYQAAQVDQQNWLEARAEEIKQDRTTNRNFINVLTNMLPAFSGVGGVSFQGVEAAEDSEDADLARALNDLDVLINGQPLEEGEETLLREQIYDRAIEEQINREYPRGAPFDNLEDTLAANPNFALIAENGVRAGIGRRRAQFTDPVTQADHFRNAVIKFHNDGMGSGAGWFQIVKGGMATMGQGITGGIGLMTFVPQVIQDRTPDWLDPAITSVLLSPAVGALEAHGQGNFDEATEVERQNLEAQLDIDMDQYGMQILQGGVQAAMVEMENRNPDVFAENVEMVGSPAALASLLQFQAEEDPQIKQNLSNLSEGARELVHERLDVLDASEYSLHRTLLDGIAMYGNLVDGLGTALLIGALDEDFHDALSERHIVGAWEALVQAGEDADWTPSNFMGLEGTFIGLGLDLGLGTLVDPMNFALAPLGRVTRVVTRASAARVSKSLPVSRRIEDVLSVLNDIDLVPGALAMHLDDFATVGLDGALLRRITDDVTLFDRATGTRSPWRQSTRAPVSGHVQIEILEDLLPEGVLDDLTRGVKDHAEYAALADDGMKEPIQLAISRKDQSVIIEDGRSRYAAAREAGHKQVPITFRVVDEFKINRARIDPRTPKRLVRTQIADARQALVDIVMRRAGPGTVGREVTEAAVQIRKGLNPGAGGSNEAWQLHNGTRELINEVHNGAPNEIWLYKSVKSFDTAETVGKHAIPTVGDDPFKYVLASTSRSKEAAKNFGARTWGDDYWIIAFDPDTAVKASRVDVQGTITDRTGDALAKLEQESIVSGEYTVTKVNLSTREITVKRTADLFDDLPAHGTSLDEWLGVDGAKAVDMGNAREVLDDTVTGEWMHPRDVVPPQMRRGKIDLTQEEMTAAFEEALARGADLDGANRLMAAQEMATYVHNWVQTGTLGPHFRRMVAGADNIPYVSMTGPDVGHVMSRMVYFAEGGRNPAFLNKWLDEFFELSASKWSRSEEILAAQLEAAQLRKTSQQLKDFTGFNQYDDVIARLDIDRQLELGKASGEAHPSVVDDAGDVGRSPEDIAETGSNQPEGFEALDELDADSQGVLDAENAFLREGGGDVVPGIERELGGAAQDAALAKATALRERIEAMMIEQTRVRETLAALDDSVAEAIHRQRTLQASQDWEKNFVETFRRFEDDYFETFLKDRFPGISSMDDMAAARLLPERTIDPISDTRVREVKKESLEDARAQEAADELEDKLADPLERTGAEEDFGFGGREPDSALEMDLRRLARSIDPDLDRPVGLFMRMSPLEMVAASEATGAVWRRVQHLSMVNMARQGSWTFMNAWVLDKIMRPSTFMVMSGDEILFQLHRLGQKGFLSYMDARLLRWEAEMQALARGQKPVVATGTAYMSPSRLRRLQEYQDVPVNIRNAEASLHDEVGVSMGELLPDDPKYINYQHQATEVILNNKGFHAYLDGREAFEAWWNSDAALNVRQTGRIADGPNMRLMNDAAEAWQFWDNLFEYGYRRPLMKSLPRGKTIEDGVQAWRETVQKIKDTGQAQRLPDWAVRDLGPVNGVRQVPQNAGGLARMVDEIGRIGITGPANFRQGWIARNARQQKTHQLEKLAADQDIPILSYPELEVKLGLEPGVLDTSVSASALVDDLAEQMGVWTQGRIRRIADNYAEAQIRKQTYMWSTVSRAGHSARPFAPFVRAWGEMWRRWGRELSSRPTLRGQATRPAYQGMRNAANSVIDWLPFNPKTAGFMSRLAGTNFKIDRGFGLGEGGRIPGTGESEEPQGLIPGTESTDLSPFFFLPVGGDENPLAVMIPGLGPFPMMLIDGLLELFFDPVEEPEEYRNIINAVSEVFPYVAFQQGGITSRLAGGGNIGNMITLFGDLSAAGNTTTPFGATSLVGDVNREIMLNREISVQFGDPTFIADLKGATSADEIMALLDAGVAEANTRASIGHAGRTIVRSLLPINADFHTAPADLDDLWIEVAATEPLIDPGNLTALKDPEARRQTANQIRRAFFDLPLSERDLIIAGHLEIAANVVPSWVWTQEAVDQGLTEDVLIPYRPDGSNTSLIRHDNLVRKSLIRPMNGNLRARLVVGTWIESQFAVIRRAYEEQAGLINDDRWTYDVKPDTKAELEFLADKYPELGYTARTLWEDFGGMQQFFVEDFTTRAGIAFGTAGYKQVAATFSAVPSKEAAWGTEWRGDDMRLFSARFRERPMFEISPLAQRAAEVLGLSFEEGMSGEAFVTGLVDAKNDAEGILWQTIRPEYRVWRGGRMVANEVDGMLRDLETKSGLSVDYRTEVQVFRKWVMNLTDEVYQEEARIPRAVQDQVFERFGALAHVGKDLLDWDRVWQLGFASRFGPLVWDSPEPRPLFKEDGNLNSKTAEVFVQDVIDGDSIAVSLTSDIRMPFFGGVEGTPRHFEVRLLGLDTAESQFDPDKALAQTRELVAAIRAGIERGDRISIVRDPNFAGSEVDPFGRTLAWLYIGDEPYWAPDEIRRGA